MMCTAMLSDKSKQVVEVLLCMESEPQVSEELTGLKTTKSSLDTMKIPATFMTEDKAEKEGLGFEMETLYQSILIPTIGLSPGLLKVLKRQKYPLLGSSG